MQVPSEEEVFATKVKESFADRISKGFADLTQGSSDRLQRWKNKLQSSARRGAREKDTSEPPPLSRKMPSVEPADVQIEWSCSVPRTQGPRPLHASRSASNAIPSSISHNSIPTLRQQTSDYSEDMEHRTLKARENSTASSQKDLSFHYQNMKSLHDLVQTIEGYSNNKTTVEQSGALPPPARITPYSGVRPKDGGDLIRPIAFRPSVMGRSRPNEEPPLMKRQSATSSSSSNIFQRPQQNDSRPPANNLGQARSSLNLASTVPAQPLRPRGIYQPSTSSSNIASAFSRPEENDYDTVPDYVAKEKCGSEASNGTSDYSTPFSTNGSNANPAPFTQHSSTTSSLSSSNSTSAVHSPPTSNNVKRVGTSASRTGVHVTPSPSDSGIVDYETIIRDKENELRDVRMTMEQNEEIIVRVYLEKEKAWKEELSDLRLRLASANKGEDALRLQLHRCTQQQQQMAATIQNLTAEKQGLQRKCLQLEKEMFAMKARLDNKTCENCSRLNGGNSKAPIPAPRASKESSHDRELRDEVEVLKGEVGHLREALTGQINLFAEERRRWEQEKNHQAKTENRSVTVGRDRLI